MTVFYSTALALYAVGAFMWIFQVGKKHWAFGVGALAYSFWVIDDILAGKHPVILIVDTTFVGVFAYLWWKNGGDDDSKRLGRRLKDAFKPVRRTAPQPV